MPVLLTPFVGRQAEVEEVCHLLSNPAIRLITLYGTAGTGKTRLSIAIAEKVQNQFRDGIYFVNLAPISRPELGLSAIAQAFGIRDQGQVPLLKRLQSFVHKQQILLILDNFEQLIPLGVTISELLLAAPELKVLITSRVVLQLYGEHVYDVPMMSLPDSNTAATLPEIAQNDSVRLFVQQASMGNSGFTLTSANAAVVAELCIRLEGLPLAIELAAARCDVFSPQALLNQLGVGNRFELLVGHYTNLPARQQTLAGAIEWSYKLLSEPEKQVFRKLGLFVSCGTAGTAQVMESDNPATLEIITSLLNKSFLRRVEMPAAGEVCFTMLETIREFALTKLAEAGELEDTRNIFCDIFIALVEAGPVNLQLPVHSPWLKCLQANHPNILSALDYLIEGGMVEKAYRMGAVIWEAWWHWGYLNEGRQWLTKLLKLDRSNLDPALQARVLDGIACLAMQQGDNRLAQPYLEEAQAIWRSKDPDQHLCRNLRSMAVNMRALNNYHQALQLNYECLELCRAQGDKVSEADLLCIIGGQLMERGKYEPVQALLEKSLDLYTELKHELGIAGTKNYLGELQWRQGQTDRAIETLGESIELLRKAHRPGRLSSALYRQGLVYLCTGQVSQARRLLEEALDNAEDMVKQPDLNFIYSSLGLLKLLENDLAGSEALLQASLNIPGGFNQLEGVLWSLEGMVVLVVKKGNLEEARTLLEKAGQLRQEIEAPVLPHTARFILPVLEKNELVCDSYKQYFVVQPQPQVPRESGTTADVTPVATQPLYQYPVVSELSKRESEVLQLVAQGHPTSQIARILVLSPGTVNKHLNSIYTKLGVNSRTRAVRYALDNGLLT